MSVIDEVLEANEIYSRTHELRRLTPRPARKLAIIYPGPAQPTVSVKDEKWPVELASVHTLTLCELVWSSRFPAGNGALTSGKQSPEECHESCYRKKTSVNLMEGACTQQPRWHTDIEFRGTRTAVSAVFAIGPLPPLSITGLRRIRALRTCSADRGYWQ